MSIHKCVTLKNVKGKILIPEDINDGIKTTILRDTRNAITMRKKEQMVEGIFTFYNLSFSKENGTIKSYFDKCRVNNISYTVSMDCDNKVVFDAHIDLYEKKLKLTDYDFCMIQFDIGSSKIYSYFDMDQFTEMAKLPMYRIIKFSIVNGNCIREVEDTMNFYEEDIKGYIEQKRNYARLAEDLHSLTWYDYEEVKQEGGADGNE